MSISNVSKLIRILALAISTSATLLVPEAEGMIKKNNNCHKTKHRFTEQEDDRLIELVAGRKTVDWYIVASYMKDRTARQCRERYLNYLKPDIDKHYNWTDADDHKLLELVKELGRVWSKMTPYFPGVSRIAIRTHFNTLENKMLKTKPDGTQPINGTLSNTLPDASDQNDLDNHFGDSVNDYYVFD